MFVTGPTCLRTDTERAHWITHVIAAWPYLEHKLGLSLAHLLDTKADIGVTMYNALRSNGAQWDVLEKTAEYVLEREDLEVFGLLLELTETVAKCRNKIAHGMWGFSSESPKKLVRVEPKALLREQARQVQVWHLEGTYKEHIAFTREDAREWAERDFRDPADRIVRLTLWFDRFWVIRTLQPPERDEQRSELRAALEAEISPPQKAAKKKPKARPKSPRPRRPRK
jgi:hypothetical protein